MKFLLNGVKVEFLNPFNLFEQKFGKMTNLHIMKIVTKSFFSWNSYLYENNGFWNRKKV